MRQFLSSDMPDFSGRLVVRGKDYRYLCHVLRLRCGQCVDVRLPSGSLCTMSVVEATASFLVLQLHAGSVDCADTAIRAETGVSALSLESRGDRPAGGLWLFQFLPKAQKMDLIVRQSVEVGVSVVVPVVGSRSQKSDCSARLDRWSRIVREARQQSGSPVSTEVLAPCDLSTAIALWQSRCGTNPCAVVLCESGESYETLHACVADGQGTAGSFSCVALAVGCEGGISPDELAALSSSGFRPVHFDTNILRVETAALYGLAALQILLTERETWRLNESSC